MIGEAAAFCEASKRLAAFEQGTGCALQAHFALVLRDSQAKMLFEEARHVHRVQIEIGGNRAERLSGWIRVQAFENLP